ncbi:MAG: DUF1588 domain-containing protein [Myxococcales bacterium]|nr:DUF1588 domain-containing protein [Myxococcales bacterium]MCB9718488.1 DUF1588 domain-containing protein [Myxococcales bacterium]
MTTWLAWGCAALIVASGCGTAEDDDGSVSGTGTAGDESGDSSTGGPPPSGDVGLDPLAVPEPRAGRLNDQQYRYTVLDLLGVELTPAELEVLPRDIPSGRDYSTTIDPQFFNSSYVLAYAEIARSVSERLEPAALLAEFAGCDGVDPGCRPAFVAGLGRRLLRRPLDEDEHSRYLDLAMTIASVPQTREDDVVRGIVQAMMQSPSFLYRLEDETSGEPGTVREVSGYELASRLSYFLWQSAPDEELLDFAAGPAGDGRFDPEALGDQIDRMIADPRFARTRSSFWGDYTLAARSNFATTDAALADELRTSLLASLERMSGGDGEPEPLSAIFDGRRYLMTPAVAELAGVPSLGDGLQDYDLHDLPERRGLVTHPSFLASISTTSFVGRGLFLTERLLCQHVAQPPATIAEQIETTAEATEGMTPREASQFRLGLEPVCRGCHTQFEPVAYAFERYDISGRYTRLDEHGRALYSDGVLPAFEGRPELAFHGAGELLQQLSGTTTVYACLVENMTQFGTGRHPVLDGPFHADTTMRFIDDGLGFDALARAVASSEQHTLTRVVEP